MSEYKQPTSEKEFEKNFEQIKPIMTDNQAYYESARCLFCYDAPCITACPTSIDIPLFIRQINTANADGAARTIYNSNFFGYACGKVCPTEVLCEGACVYNMMHEEPINIARLQRYSTEKAMANQWQLFERKPSTGKRVAIIGAGPAGLSCAHTLSREGVEVTIYEKESKGGGLMTYGIAAYKVTPEFCEDEVNYITSIGGISIKYNHELGRNITVEELQRNYDAVFLAFGVGLARQLDIPGENLFGVVDAIKFIYDLRDNDYSQIAIGDKVAVIGMGMTAIDAATQAKRLGAGEVHLIYRRTQEEMPCTEKELDIAKLDGCTIIWLAAPKEILGDGNNVTQLVCDVMKLGEPDASGRRSPVVSGETFTLDVDMVIKAAGQMPFQSLVNANNIENNNGKIAVSGKSASKISGVFAGGDCVNGGREVVDAVQAGKDGAAAILKYIISPDYIIESELKPTFNN